MHKKIEAELVSLAHSILQLKNKGSVNELHKKARDIYEKLSVLKFVDENLSVKSNSLGNDEKSVTESDTILTEEMNVEFAAPIEILDVIEKTELFSEEEVEEFYNDETPVIKEDNVEISSFQISLEEEFKDAISADVATNLFERVTKENPIIKETVETKQRSLNDTLFKNNLQIGLNDRIAFVKHLFEGNQEDFNRVLSQLNSFKTEKEAINFLEKIVKPDYDWSANEEYEQRLLSLIERKFL